MYLLLAVQFGAVCFYYWHPKHLYVCMYVCMYVSIYICIYMSVRGKNLSGARFPARPDRPWGPPSLLYNGYRVFPGGKVRPGRDVDHSPPSSAEVMEE